MNDIQFENSAHLLTHLTGEWETRAINEVRMMWEPGETR